MSGAVQGALAPESLEGQIPVELLSYPQWIAWWSVAGEGRRARLPNGSWTGVLKPQPKPHKLPIDPHTGGLAASTRPTTWSSPADAFAAVAKWTLTGIGFVFTDSDPYSGVDIDNCRDPESGEIAEWAWEIIRALESYAEVSPSVTGVHVIVRGKLPRGQGNQAVVHRGKVEMYSRARYFTFTGTHVAGTSTAIQDRQAELLKLHEKLFAPKATVENAPVPSPALLPNDEELIAKARQAQNGCKFDRLWSGQWESDYPSQSEADLALCSRLAFWTGRDIARVDRLFRRSGLMRNKWLRNDYREETMAKAVVNTTDT